MEEQKASGLCLILSGGEFCALPEELRRTADCVIACDKGYEYAERLGLKPDLIIGDFDSSPPPVTDLPVERLPTRKDDTDTMLGVKRALERGFRDIVICCALGGRLDHAFANIQSAAFVAARGGRARLLGEDTDIVVFRDSKQVFPRREGWSFSVFALSDECSGVSVEGTKYACRDVTLRNSFPLGVSNVWTAKEAAVSADRGILMVVQSRLKNGEHI